MKFNNMFPCFPCGTPSVTHKDCDDCIYGPKLDYSCGEGMNAGTSVIINILTVSEYTLPTGNWKFSVVDTFSDIGVTIDATTSELTINAGNLSGGVYKIPYIVEEVGGIRSATGEVSMCVLPLGKDCKGSYNKDLNSCVESANHSKSDMQCGQEYTFDVSLPVDHLNTEYYINSQTGNFTVTLLGSIVKVKADTSSIEFGKEFKISYRKRLGTVYNDGVITVKFKDMCEGFVLGNGKQCDSCTGVITDIPTNLSVGHGSNLKIS